MNGYGLLHYLINYTIVVLINYCENHSSRLVYGLVELKYVIQILDILATTRYHYQINHSTWETVDNDQRFRAEG